MSGQFCSISLFKRSLLDDFCLQSGSLFDCVPLLWLKHVIFPEGYPQVFAEGWIFHQLFRFFIEVNLNLHFLVLKADNLVFKLKIFYQLFLTVFRVRSDLNFERGPNLEISVSFLRQISLRPHTWFHLLEPPQSNFPCFNRFKLLWNLHRLTELNSEKAAGIEALNDWFRNELLNFFGDKGRIEFCHALIIQQINFLKLDHFFLICENLFLWLLPHIVHSLIIGHLYFIKRQLFSLISELGFAIKLNSFYQSKLNVVQPGERCTCVVVCKGNDNIFDDWFELISRTLFYYQNLTSFIVCQIGGENAKIGVNGNFVRLIVDYFSQICWKIFASESHQLRIGLHFEVGSCVEKICIGGAGCDCRVRFN